jgi:peroxiredoxin (alkyl hydroperoxide reductase subunit C)
MAADIKQDIMKAYDVQSADGVAFRGAFLIDDKGVVRSQIVNDLPLGRNMEELIRLVDALQFHEEHGEVCPANWKKGDKGMNASPEGVAAYLTEHAAAL